MQTKYSNNPALRAIEREVCDAYFQVSKTNKFPPALVETTDLTSITDDPGNEILVIFKFTPQGDTEIIPWTPQHTAAINELLDDSGDYCPEITPHQLNQSLLLVYSALK